MNPPEPIHAYFTASNAGDTERAVACFAQDAEVHDEGHTHRGLSAIRLWAIEAKQRFDFQVTPVRVEQDQQTVRVRAQVSGNFPGSPIALTHVFELHDGRIASLRIG